MFVLLKNRIVGDRGEERGEKKEMKGEGKNENRRTKRGKVGRRIEKNCVHLKKSHFFKAVFRFLKQHPLKCIKMTKQYF